VIHRGEISDELLFDARELIVIAGLNRYLLEGMFPQQLYGVFEVYQIS